MKANESDIEISSDWCYYLVAFLDVLGQKEVFARLSKIRAIEEIDDSVKRDISENFFLIIYSARLNRKFSNI